MAFKLSNKSLANLEGVHSDLVAVVKLAMQYATVDFCVTEGLRSKERQCELYALKATETLNSRHLSGHAVDVAAWVDGVRWEMPLYERIAQAMFAAAEELGVKIQWGGHWDMKDGPHFQLCRKRYPVEACS